MNKKYYIFMFLFVFALVKDLISMEFTYADIRIFVDNKTEYTLRVEKEIGSANTSDWKFIADIAPNRSKNITNDLKEPGGKFDETVKIRVYLSPVNKTAFWFTRATLSNVVHFMPFSPEITKELESGYKEVAFNINSGYTGLYMESPTYFIAEAFQDPKLKEIPEQSFVFVSEEQKPKAEIFYPESGIPIYEEFKGSMQEPQIEELTKGLSEEEVKSMIDSINKALKVSNIKMLDPIYRSGYYYLAAKQEEEIVPENERSNKTVKDLKPNLTEEEEKQIKKELAGNYKIHLMPKDLKELEAILARLFRRIGEDARLKNVINTIKIYSKADFTSKEKLLKSLKQTGENMSIVVIYPVTGQEEARYLLHTIIDLYRDLEGADITPRYNQKVNNLIYYAQGDADYKTDIFKEYYEEPNRIFYKNDFEGEVKDYRLL